MIDHSLHTPSRSERDAKPMGAHRSDRPDATFGAGLAVAVADNQEIQAQLRRGAVQPKLAISPPDDPLEREADEVAETVVQRKEACSCGGTCEECQQREQIQLKRNATHAHRDAQMSASPSVVNRLGAGRSLDATTRRFFESNLNHDFSRTRIHADRVAEQVMRIQGLAVGHSRDVTPTLSPLVQRQVEAEEDEEEVLQGKFTISETPAQLQGDLSEAESRTAMPDPLKTGLEALSGMNLSGVRVHTNSSKPGQLNALAYTQGQDIHVGPGQEKHLPHEGWHAVQQMQGRVRPMMQAKEVSINDDEELEREADVMGAKALQMSRFESSLGADLSKGAPATVAPAGGMAPAILQRDPEKKDLKHPGSAGETPFDVADLPPGTLEEIEALGVAELSSLANDMVNHAYTNFLAACHTVKGRLAKKKNAREEKEKKWVEMAIGAAGLMLGGIGGVIGARVAAAPIQKMVTNGVLNKMPGLLKRIAPRMAEDARGRLTLSVLQKLSGERITEMFGKLGGEAGAATVSSLVGQAAGKAAAAVAKVDINGEKEDKAVAYVNALEETADGSAKALLSSVGASSDAGALIGVYQTFSAASLSVYTTEIDTKANNFMYQIAGTIGKDREQIVTINAYGKKRLATVLYNTDSITLPYYRFISWVTPDMEGIARGLNPNAREISPMAIINHIPSPVEEGAVFGQEMIRKVDAWGKYRLIVVRADKGFWSTDYGKINFVRWVPEDRQAEAEVKGGAQIGGIAKIDAGKIRGLQPPPGV